MDAKLVIALLSAVALAAAASCTTLPALTGGCGNKVIDDGEDCDGNYEASANKCIEPGPPTQCHWSCDSTSCPSPFACGVDKVCRRPAGTFTQSIAVNAESSRRVMLGDFDGDGAKDVVAVGATSRVHFFDKRTTTKQTLLSANGEIPALGQVTTDGRTSGVLTTTFSMNGQVQGNVRVWRGSADRTLLPTVYPNIDLSIAQVTSGRAISVIRDINGEGSDVFALFTMGGAAKLFDVTGTLPFDVPIATSNVVGPVEAIHGRIPVGVLGDGTCATDALLPFNYCQAIVLAFDGDTSVSVHSTCNTALGVNAVNDAQFVPPLTFALPNADKVAGPAFLVYPTNTAPPHLYVQGQQGVYDFPGTVCSLATASSTPVIVPKKQKDIVLAMGFIEDALDVDWVDGEGIHVNYGVGQAITAQPANPGGWTDAIIGDLNLNGLPDVVALSMHGIDFYNGTGSTLLNGKHFTVDGTASSLAVGDYDGDFVSDIAFSTTGDSTGLATDSINVAFGTFTGFPIPPVSVGRLDAVAQLEPTLFDYRIAGSADFISTLFAIGKTDDTKHDLIVSILQGSPDRLINSPYFLSPVEKASLVTTSVAIFNDASPTAHPGLAGFAVSTKGEGALWFTPMTGDAQVDLQGESVAPLPTNVTLAIDGARGFDRAGMAAIDVGGSTEPGDELLIVQPNRFFLTHVGKWPVLAFETPSDLGVDASADTKGVVTRVADVDDDGDKDVIVEYFDGKFFVAKILINDMNGTLSFANASPLVLPQGTVAVTTIHASKDGKTQLLAVSQNGVYLAQMVGGTLGPWSAVFALSGVSGVRDAIAGDVDGDGVDDVVLGTATGFFVVFGNEATL